MKQRSQNEWISDFVQINGTGTILLRNGMYRDVQVHGFFKRWNWWFIIHSDVEQPEYVTVSEASTGRRLKNDVYYTAEDALYFCIPFIDQKHYYFATTVGNALVETGVDLLYRNIGLQTLAIDSLLW